MSVITKRYEIQSKGEGHILNITGDLSEALIDTKLTRGILTVFVEGSTGALTTIEYEPGLLKDFSAMLERIASKYLIYEHEKRWHDGNGHSHIRASVIGPTLTIPFVDKRLTLGTWQQIVFVELDVRSRRRNLVLQFIGE